MTTDARANLQTRRNALGSLSSIGAGVAGVGGGILFARHLTFALWPLLVVGVVVHLYGMVGLHRLGREEGRNPTTFETVGYRLCWAAIAMLVIYLAVLLSGGIR